MILASMYVGTIAFVTLLTWFRRSWEACEEGELVRLVLEGKTAAYGVLVRRYERRLYAVVRRMVHSHEDVDDIVQDAFIRAYRSLDSFDTSRRFYTWLCRIGMNLAINLTDKERRRATDSLDEHCEKTGFQAASDAEASEVAEHDELSAAVKRALDELPEGMREVFVLRTFDDMSYDEIAEALDVPRGTVMSRLARARKHVQTALQPFLAEQDEAGT